MNNRGAGRGFKNPNADFKPGNWPGNNSKRKSPQTEQKSRDDGARETSSPVSHEACSSQRPGFGSGSNNSGNRNNYDNRLQRGRGPWISSNRNKPKAFSLSPNSSADTDFDQKSNSSDDYKDRVKSRMNSLQSAKATRDEKDRNAIDSAKSSISPSTCAVVMVKTESGPFECSCDSPDQNESLQGGSNNAEGFNIKREQSCVTEVDGDLFSARENVSLAHCVGADLRMGSGVAVRFRTQFQSIGRLFDQHVEPGGVATIPAGRRHIFYLITKQASTDKPTIDTMRNSLLALREKCKQLKVTELAMPQIGCGLDGLSWIDVKQMLEEIFVDGFAITIYRMDTDSADTRKLIPKSRVVNNNLMLKDIQPGTGLLYIGYGDAFVSEEMQSINEKYPFLSRLKNLQHKPGSAVYAKSNKDDIVYGLICKEKADCPLSYELLEAAIKHLKSLNKWHEYGYFGLQAFEEKDDPYVMEKIDTLFRNSFIDAEFWICWPPSMEHKRLKNLEQNNSAMQVQESQYVASGNRQSSSPQPSNSSKKSKDRKKNNNSPKNQSRGVDTPEDSNSQDQAVREVEQKMSAQSLGDESESWIHNSETENGAKNTSDMNWDDDDKLLAEVPDPVDSTLDTYEGGWYGEDQHAEDERRKSNEKKKVKQLAKEKERQDKRNVAKPKSCVTEFKGDLFEAEDTMCLAHCVGADFRMGSGIAVIFRREFGNIGELLDQGVTQGGVAYIQHKKRYIFYLVTKQESTGKPTYDTLERSLLELHKICKQLNVAELAMPRIGCGLDRLEWSEVKKMLEDIFADGFSIKIYNLEKPSYSPNTSGSGRSSWVEADNKRMAAMLRDIQQTQEATYRRLIGLEDVKQQIHAPDGLKTTTDENTSRINELDRAMHELSNKIDAVVQDFNYCYECNEALQARVTLLETSKQDSEKKIELLEASNRDLVNRLENLEQRLQLPQRSVAPTGYYFNMNGNYSSTNIPDGPAPLVQSSAGPPAWSPTGDYYPGNIQFVHPGYSPQPQFYATDQLPEEREALIRAAQHSATKHGYDIKLSENGTLFMRKKGHHFKAIYSHGDLSSLEN